MRHLRLLYPTVLAIIFQSAAWAQDAPAARTGATVYEAHCANCHGGGFGGFFSGAPKTGDRNDWSALVPKGLDGLTATTLAGIGRMGPRGGCTVCTDAEIRAAVEYMLQASQ
jgi:cytochrome c5